MTKKIGAVAALLSLVLFPRTSVAKDPADPLTDWSVARMSRWSPPGKYAWGGEGPAEARLRYVEIARAARSVAFDPDEEPIFPGPDGRIRTMAVLLAVSSVESGGFQGVTDFGLPGGVGDSGRSWCLMQVRLSEMDPSSKRTWHRVVLGARYWEYAFDGKAGWGGEDLVADRAKCFRAGLHIVRKSFHLMAGRPEEERLAAYASGKTTSGLSASRKRMRRAIDWLKEAPPSVLDASVMADLRPPPSS